MAPEAPGGWEQKRPPFPGPRKGRGCGRALWCARPARVSPPFPMAPGSRFGKGQRTGAEAGSPGDSGAGPASPPESPRSLCVTDTRLSRPLPAFRSSREPGYPRPFAWSFPGILIYIPFVPAVPPSSGHAQTQVRVVANNKLTHSCLEPWNFAFVHHLSHLDLHQLAGFSRPRGWLSCPVMHPCHRDGPGPRPSEMVGGQRAPTHESNCLLPLSLGHGPPSGRSPHCR